MGDPARRYLIGCLAGLACASAGIAVSLGVGAMLVFVGLGVAGLNALAWFGVQREAAK